MKKVILTLVIAVFAVTLPAVAAQEKGKSDESAKTSGSEKPVTPLRVQVVFSEFDGEKKISSLPYTILVNADDRGAVASMRMGLRVPIYTSTGDTKQITYLDLGTNLDGRAEKADDGRFILKLSVERSSAYSPDPDRKSASLGVKGFSSEQPIIQQFRTNVNLLIRDAQTIQSTVATDPITGHVVKVDVTLNVIK